MADLGMKNSKPKPVQQTGKAIDYQNTAQTMPKLTKVYPYAEIGQKPLKARVKWYHPDTDVGQNKR
jgi:hypothetical protein